MKNIDRMVYSFHAQRSCPTVLIIHYNFFGTVEQNGRPGSSHKNK